MGWLLRMAYSIREAFTGFRQGVEFVEFFYCPRPHNHQIPQNEPKPIVGAGSPAKTACQPPDLAK
jgi:hypothetical protein